MKISENTIAAVKSVSLPEIIGQYVNLKKSGHQFIGLCPFHNEKTASFYVNPAKGFKCFGCDISGNNAISFIMKYYNKNYLEAVVHIASIMGLSIEYDMTKSNFRKPVIKEPKMLTDVNLTNISFIKNNEFEGSMKKYDKNYFVHYLRSLFGEEITKQLIKKYFIGTSKHWDGATVFWQVDIHQRVRTGKIILYDPVTGKRVKIPHHHVNWVHSIIKQIGFNLKQCLFGEHLLFENIKPVALVESEKTAIIASAYIPAFTWLATGGLNGLTSEKCQVLSGHEVTLFPDLNGFEEWSKKIKEHIPKVKLNISDLLELKATDEEKKQKLDIADYLINLNYQDF